MGIDSFHYSRSARRNPCINYKIFLKYFNKKIKKEITRLERIYKEKTLCQIVFVHEVITLYFLTILDISILCFSISLAITVCHRSTKTQNIRVTAIQNGNSDKLV